MKLKYHSPGRGTDPDTVVFAPYPWAGNDQNTGGRYSFLADNLGVIVIAASQPGTGAVHIDRATRAAAKPDGFPQLAQRVADVVGPAMDEFPVRLGLGDSGRAILVAQMIIANPDLFTHFLGRDGTNLNAPESLFSVVRRVLSQREDPTVAVSAEAHRHVEDYKLGAGEALPRVVAVARGLSELLIFGDLAAGTSSGDSVRAVAGMSGVAMRYVGFTHGLSGSEDQARAFNTQLEAARIAAIGAQPDASHAGYEFVVIPGTHPDLTNPDILVADVQSTLALARA